MAVNTADGALLLVKKFGGLVLIFFGILGVALGLFSASSASRLVLSIVQTGSLPNSSRRGLSLSSVAWRCSR
jgi:hypothetical protein